MKCDMSITVCFRLKPLKKKKKLTQRKRTYPPTLYIISDELQTIVIVCGLNSYGLCCVFVCVCTWSWSHTFSMPRQHSVKTCKWSTGCRHPCSVLIRSLDANISTIHLQTCSKDYFQQVSPCCRGSERNLLHTHIFLRFYKLIHMTCITRVCLSSNSFKEISNAFTTAGTKSHLRACSFFFF